MTNHVDGRRDAILGAVNKARRAGVPCSKQHVLVLEELLVAGQPKVTAVQLIRLGSDYRHVPTVKNRPVGSPEEVLGHVAEFRPAAQLSFKDRARSAGDQFRREMVLLDETLEPHRSDVVFPFNPTPA
ncbi:MAG TPA: hypothetical protein VN495_03220 [Candidatus Paceibacterota bacterium]|nr:hypothetical protein [Candidatus Paceibacterota bacterium]